ncbi:hypothetical protein PAXINDRAFT_169719 [Paxillus involutus ATCC 200175]|uniref:RING-type domain-containing protein n=1 Tax=Paxillus involutus ATCC 200175 TaxID=664439 RepID=A0A0C9SXR8_PAXIN|nr:hypothetical protein PAXINDRAFT_169719 [Paxillus involutus ATCC 200175]
MDEAASSQLPDTSPGTQSQTFDVKPMLVSARDAHLDDVQDDLDVKKGIVEGCQVTRYCFSCSQLFNTDDDFRGHRDVCPSRRILQPKCPLCCTQFDDELSLRRHVDDRQMSFSCRLCNLLCCSDGMLEEHIKDHPTCRRCGNHFIDDQDLCKHVELEHPAMVCWDCGGALVEQYGLEHHYTDSPDHPTCAFCGVGMKNVDAMNEHVHAHHAAEPLVVPNDQSPNGDDLIEPSDEVSRQLSSKHECDKPASSSHDEDECLTSFTSPPLVPFEHGSEEGRSHPAVHQPWDPPLSAPTECVGDTSVQSPHLPSGQSITNVAAIVVAPNGSPVRLPSSTPLEPQELVQHLSNGVTPSVVIAEPSISTIAHRLHCRICRRDPCDDMMATICGHIFCKKCITQAVIAKPECPVCKSATLLYCLFKFDLTA